MGLAKNVCMSRIVRIQTCVWNVMAESVYIKPCVFSHMHQTVRVERYVRNCMHQSEWVKLYALVRVFETSRPKAHVSGRMF